MPTLAIAVTAYLALAMLLVIVVDNLVGLLFREQAFVIVARRSAFAGLLPFPADIIASSGDG
jgi:hypothetical protein